ncbi:uncharacterized protein LOC112685100 [Sipha flava]|uniref:Uncharacterized protein LOC112685100 n=1 Tax=Sipha flava TaxID=143950 RepID=A0A8B8FQ95_9HEMI|nr:uncharacterized protein LOC112685100 [Sipha flava]
MISTIGVEPINRDRLRREVEITGRHNRDIVAEKCKFLEGDMVLYKTYHLSKAHKGFYAGFEPKWWGPVRLEKRIALPPTISNHNYGRDQSGDVGEGAELLLWAAYCRGWADRTTDLVRSLGSSAARSPGTPPTPKPPRLSTRHRVTTAKAMGSGCAKPATGAAPAGRSIPFVRTTPTTHGVTTITTSSRQATSSARPQRDVTWVRPASGRPLVPRMPPADPHPPTTEWTGMPSRVAYVERLPTPPPAPPSDKPRPLEPWPKPAKPATPTTSTRSAERAKERRREHQRQRRLRAKAESFNTIKPLCKFNSNIIIRVRIL